MVDRLQLVFVSNFFPLTDKSSDNPRFKFLHALLGRGSDALDAATDNAALDDVVEVDLQDSSSASNPPSDTDNVVSSDDDDASKALPVASRLLLLQHLRLCSIALLLTRCRMRLSVVVFDCARSLHASTLARCSNLRLVEAVGVSSPCCHRQGACYQQVASCRSQAMTAVFRSYQAVAQELG